MAIQDRVSTSAPTATERANREYLERVRGLPGVLAAEPYGGATLGEQRIFVVVESMLADESDKVYQLEGEIRSKYPGSRLSVRVRGVKDTGLSAEQLVASGP